MVVKLYRYRIAARDRGRWLDIARETNELYFSFGLARAEVCERRDGDTISVLEINYYLSEADAQKIATRADTDSRVTALYNEFTRLIIDGEVTQESFDIVPLPRIERRSTP